MIKPVVCSGNWCVWFSIFTILIAFLVALIEIEIEGKHGWMENSPTPHIRKSKKSLTVYHIFLFLLMLLVFNTVFFIYPKSLSLGNFFFTLAITLMFFVLEDFYWFVLNPYYKITGMGKAWWHRKAGPVPIIYIILPLIALGLSFCAGYVNTFLKSVLIMLVGTGVVLAISPAYHIIYNKTHKNMDKNMDKKNKK